MTASSSALLTRRARIIVPFLFAYGIALYLVAGAVSDAVSGQAPQGDSDLIIEAAVAAPATARAAVDSAAVSRALAAVEETDTIAALVRDQDVSVVRSGPWTASENDPDSAGPEAAVGVALTIELPEPIDIDLAGLPGNDEALVDRTPAGAPTQIERNFSSLLVLYDPAADEIVAVHPVPEGPPVHEAELGPAPDVAEQDPRAERRERGDARRDRGNRRGGKVSNRG
ncbi:MAG: hypothetical protein ACR2OD_10120 [Gaiellaceae bacterium]